MVSGVLKKTLNGCQLFSHRIFFSSWKTNIKPLEAVMSNYLFFSSASSRVLAALDVTGRLDQVLAMHSSEPVGSEILTCFDGKNTVRERRFGIFLCLRPVPYVPVHVDLIKQIKICQTHFKSNVNHKLSLIKKKLLNLHVAVQSSTKMNIVLTSPSPPPIQCCFLFMQQCDNIPNFWGEEGKIER